MAAICAAVILMLASVLGGAPRAVAETETDYDQYSEEEYRMYIGLQYDVSRQVYEILGLDRMPRSSREFEQSVANFQPELCPALMDYVIFSDAVVTTLHEIDDGEQVDNMHLRWALELAGVTWPPPDEVEPEVKTEIQNTWDFVTTFIKDRTQHLRLLFEFCRDNHRWDVGYISPRLFTDEHSPNPIDRQMRELYVSQAPLLRWILRETEKAGKWSLHEQIDTLILSAQSKYDGLSLLAPPDGQDNSPASGKSATTAVASTDGEPEPDEGAEARLAAELLESERTFWNRSSAATIRRIFWRTRSNSRAARSRC